MRRAPRHDSAGSRAPQSPGDLVCASSPPGRLMARLCPVSTASARRTPLHPLNKPESALRGGHIQA
eukprot:2682012-Prymnesium_polylepis.1